MSILIKGMEMPKSYKDIRIYADGRIVSKSLHAYGEEIAAAIPVPPHGDLIDRDALSKSLNRLCDRVCQYSKAQRKFMCSACPLGDAFTVVEDDAPIVIPASEEAE